MSKNILVKLGGVDVTTYLRSAIKTETYGDSIAKYEFEFAKNISGVVNLSNALTCEVWLDSNAPPTTKVFNGFLDLFKPEGSIVKAIAKDEFAKLINRQVMKYYDSSIQGDPAHPLGRISAIFNDLVTTYGGLKTYTSFGETTSTSAGKLVDSTKSFSTSTTNPVTIGDTVLNLTDATTTTVTAIDNDTTLSLTDDIMTTGKEYYVYTTAGAVVSNSGSDLVLPKFTCRNADIFERCRKLAETLNWVMYYNASNDRVYFEPKNNSTNSTTLTVGSNIIELPSWEYDRSEMINDLRLEGAQQLVQATQLFTGDASETEFALTNYPEDIAVYYDTANSGAKNYSTTAKLASEIIVGDVVGATSTHAYEVDKKNKKIIITSFVPAAHDNNILVESSYFAPIPIHLTNAGSITIYGTYAKTIVYTDVISFEDAWNRANNIIEKYSVPFISAKIKVLWSDSLNLKIGQAIHIVDSINTPTVDQNFSIYKIIDYYPEGITEIEVGDKQYTIEEYQANIVERLKRLEEETIGTTNDYSELVATEITDDYIAKETTVLAQFINDSFILGHSVNAVLGTGLLGNRASLSSTVTYTW